MDRINLCEYIIKLHVTISFFCLTLFLSAQPTTGKTTIYSEKVKDSFELYISTPEKMDSNQAYNVIYYCDANLKSGKKLRELISQATYKSKVESTIFVGIGHIGNFHVLRRRDFISSTISESPNFGQAEYFYQFVKTELIPAINLKYKTNAENNSIIGHSLGGLFVFYCLFKNEAVFKNYFALSPSLWVDHYDIYNFNNLTSENIQSRHLFFFAGGLEIANHIKKGTDRMKRFLDMKKYSNLNYQYQIHKGKTHNSQIEKSFDYILTLR